MLFTVLPNAFILRYTLYSCAQITTVAGKTSIILYSLKTSAVGATGYCRTCNDVNCLNDSSFMSMPSTGNNFKLWAAIYLDLMHWAVNSWICFRMQYICTLPGILRVLLQNRTANSASQRQY